MKELKQGLFNILALILFFIIVPISAYTFETSEMLEMFVAPEPEPEPEPRIYVALGDSVPAGFGVANTERYTALLFEMLKERDYIDKYLNMAEDGFTAATLLDFLHNLDEYDLNLIKSACVITLNIGGNDILAPLIEYLPTQEDVMDIALELWDFIQESFELVSEVIEIAHDFQDAIENFNPWRVWELPALINMVQEASPVLGDVTDMFDSVNELQLVRMLPMLQGSFSPELDDMLLDGVDSFAVEFNKIIVWLNTHAPDAVIIVNTVYNPIPNQIFGLSLEGLSDRGSAFVRSINNIILENGYVKGYLVADVYTGFAGEPDNFMNFFVDTTALTFSFDIIHPSVDGHRMIAGMNYELFISR